MDATTTLLFGIPLLILIPLALAFIGLKLGLKLCKIKPTNFKEILFVVWTLSYVTGLIITCLIFFAPAQFYSLFGGFFYTLPIIGLLIAFALSFFLDYVSLTRVFSFGKGDASKVSASMGIFTNTLIIFFILLLLLTVIDSAGGFYKTNKTAFSPGTQSQNNALCRTAICTTNAACTTGATPANAACEKFSAGTCVGVQQIGGTTVSGSCQPNATAIYTATGSAIWA
jgi:hypothetical protein